MILHTRRRFPAPNKERVVFVNIVSSEVPIDVFGGFHFFFAVGDAA